jgi:hemoglobin
MINKEIIDRIIFSFYQKAKSDVLIGYHFRIISDFDSHIPRISDFWNLQLNGKIEDRSRLPYNLIEVHRPLKIKMGEVNRWTFLFEQTLKEFSQEISQKQSEEFMQKITHFKEIITSKLILE